MTLEDIKSPFDGSVIGQVPVASLKDVDGYLTRAEVGSKLWRNTPAHVRSAIILKAATIATVLPR